MYLVDKIIKYELEKEKITENDVESLRERLELTIGYGDIAMRVYGNWCFHLTQAAVCFTQFMVCVMYFVFISNTVYEMFPVNRVQACDPIGNDSAVIRESMYRVKTERGGIGIPVLHVPNLSLNSSGRHRRSATNCSASDEKTPNLARNLQPQTDLNANLMALEGLEEIVVPRQERSGEKTGVDEMLFLESKNDTGVCNVTIKSTAPDLKLVVLFPLPIFLCTSLVRNVRFIAPFSSISTVAMVAGAVAVLTYVIKGRQKNSCIFAKV